MKISRSKSPKGQAKRQAKGQSKGQSKKKPKKQSKANVPKKVKGQSKLNKKKKPSGSSISRKKGSKKKSSKKKKTGVRVLGVGSLPIKLNGATCNGSNELSIDEDADLELALQNCNPKLVIDYMNMNIKPQSITDLKIKGFTISYKNLREILNVNFKNFIVKEGEIMHAESKHNNLLSMPAILDLNSELEEKFPEIFDESMLQEGDIHRICLTVFPQLFRPGYPYLYFHIGIGSGRLYCNDDKQFDVLYNKVWIETKRQQIHGLINEEPIKELPVEEPLNIRKLIDDKMTSGKHIYLNINIDRTINGKDEPVLISYLKLKYRDTLNNDNLKDIILSEYESGQQLGLELFEIPHCLVHILNEKDRLIVFVTLKADVNITTMEHFFISAFAGSLALANPIDLYHT